MNKSSFTIIMFAILVIMRLGIIALSIVAADHGYWGIVTVALLGFMLTSFKSG